jgi:hypothetical protein
MRTALLIIKESTTQLAYIRYLVKTLHNNIKQGIKSNLIYFSKNI